MYKVNGLAFFIWGQAVTVLSTGYCRALGLPASNLKLND